MNERPHHSTPFLRWLSARRTSLSIAGITLLFVSIYYTVRALPDTQCAILHYEVSRETADGIEMCADGPTGMMDLDRLRFPGRFELLSSATTSANTPYQGVFSLVGARGDAMLAHEVAITHSERIHLLAVDSTLSDYHHLHPTPIGATGQWEFQFTPGKPGPYLLYAECVPLRTRKQLIVHQTLQVEPSTFPFTPSESRIPAQDYELTWTFEREPIQQGTWVSFDLTLSRRDGQPVGLEKFMDAYAHVVAFRHGTTGFAHMHPDSTTEPSDLSRPTFSFTFYSGERGHYRFWAQFQIAGQSLFLPHDVEIR